MTINIKINGEDVLLLDSVEFNYQLNKPSSISFTVNKYNYGNIFDLVEVYEYEKLVFKGKITKIEPDVYNKKTKIQAIESGALRLMGKQINETFPKEDFDAKYDYCLKEENDNIYLYININNKNIDKLYIYKMYGYAPSNNFDTTNSIEKSYNTINEYVYSIDLNNSSEVIKIDVSNIINDVNESLYIFDEKSYNRINNTLYDYYIEKNNDKYNLWFKTSLPKKHKKKFIIQKGGVKNSNPDEIFKFYDNFDTLNETVWNIENGEWEISNGNLVCNSDDGLIKSNFKLEDKYIIYTKIKSNNENNQIVSILNYENQSNYDVLSQLSYIHNEVLSYQVNNDKIDSLNYINKNIEKDIYYNLKIKQNNLNIENEIDNEKFNNIFKNERNGYLSIYGKNNSNIDYIYITKYCDKDVYIEIKEIESGIYEITLFNDNEYELNDFQIKIQNFDLINSLDDKLIIRDSINNYFTDIIIYICHQVNLNYEIDDFENNTFKEYNINFTNAMNVIENIATLVGADFYIENEKLYFFKKGKNVNNLIIKDKMDNDVFIENIQINKNNSKFANKVIVIGDKGVNDITLIAEASNNENIDNYGLFETVINDTSLKTKEAVILRAVKELKNLCEIRTTGNISLSNDCNFKLGDVVKVESNSANLNQYYRIISINKKIEKDIVIKYKLGIDSQITDVPYVIKDINDRLKKLENKDVDTKINKFNSEKILIDINITQTISERNDLNYRFDEDMFDFSLFS